MMVTHYTEASFLAHKSLDQVIFTSAEAMTFESQLDMKTIVGDYAMSKTTHSELKDGLLTKITIR